MNYKKKIEEGRVINVLKEKMEKIYIFVFKNDKKKRRGIGNK